MYCVRSVFILVRNLKSFIIRLNCEIVKLGPEKLCAKGVHSSDFGRIIK